MKWHDPGKDKSKKCLVGWDTSPHPPVQNLPTNGPHSFHYVRHKGVPASAKVIDVPEGPHKGRQYVYDQFPRLSGRIALGEVGHIQTRRTFKKSTVSYDKGVVDSDGWVHPFRLPEDAAAGLCAIELAV